MEFQKEKKGFNKFARFSTMVIQMGVIIALFSWGGAKLDEKYQTKLPLWTMVLSLTGIGIAMYLIIRDILRENNRKND